MSPLSEQVSKIRSKNAGPFWVTIDIFCFDDGSFQDICNKVTTALVGQIYQVAPEKVLRYTLEDLAVIKISIPRPIFQGTKEDRDMHGASYASLLEELEIE